MLLIIFYFYPHLLLLTLLRAQVSDAAMKSESAAQSGEVAVKSESAVKMDVSENGVGVSTSALDQNKLTEQSSAEALTTAAVAAQNEEAAKEARRIAKKIINDTAKLDPNRIPQDTGRSRRKVRLC